MNLASPFLVCLYIGIAGEVLGNFTPEESATVSTPSSSTEVPCTVYPNTYYTLTNRYGGSLATVPKTEGETVTKASAVYIIRADSDIEKWSFQKAPFSRVLEKVYVIINGHNDLALTVENDAVDSWAQLNLEPYTGRKSQLFQIIPTSDGQCTFKVVHSDMFLRIDGPPTETPGPVRQLQEDTGQNVAWDVNELACDPYPNQPYRIIHRLSGLVVGLDSGGIEDNEQIKLLRKGETSTQAQVTLTAIWNQIFNISFRHSGKEFDGGIAWGDRLFQYSRRTADHQLFYIVLAYESWCTIRPIKSRHFVAPELEPDGQYIPGNHLILSETRPSANAHFRFERIGLIPNEKQTYRIRNIQADKYMEVSLGSMAPGTEIVQNPYEMSNRYQLWSFVVKGVNVYSLRSNYSNLFVKVSDDEDALVVQAPPAAADNHQLFDLVEAKSHPRTEYIFRIWSRYKDLVLMPISNDSGAVTGAQFNLLNDAQEWEIEPDVYTR